MNRSHLFAWHRLVILGIVGVLGLITLMASHGPAPIQRLFHPLRYAREIGRSARANGVDPYLVAGVMRVESGFEARIVSRQGAVGLMQVLPSTAAELRAGAAKRATTVTAEALKSPSVNIEFGTEYLADLLHRFEDTRTALAAYNAGPATVHRWLSRPGGRKITYADVAFPETKRYVRRVLMEAYYYRRLYSEAFR